MGDTADDEKPMTVVAVWQGYKIPILLGGASLLLIALSLTLLIKSYQSNEPIKFSSEPAEASVAGTPVNQVTVDVEGAVVRPGLYTLPAGSRVDEAIAKAGGLSAEADLERISVTINRAAKLSDGAKLFFPKKGDPPAGSGQGSLPSSSSIGNLSPLSTLVSVNVASQAQLEDLPGIGPVTAKKIIDNRPYQTLEELVSKKAMGQSLFQKLKEQLTL